jgi:hypothetical protein
MRVDPAILARNGGSKNMNRLGTMRFSRLSYGIAALIFLTVLAVS